MRGQGILFSIVTILCLCTQMVYALDDDYEEIEVKAVTFPNGDRYTGEYEGNIRTGRGKYTWANGDTYEGDFLEGQLDGYGTYTWANGDIYEGDYMENQRDGEGTYTWADGSIF